MPREDMSGKEMPVMAPSLVHLPLLHVERRLGLISFMDATKFKYRKYSRVIG